MSNNAFVRALLHDVANGVLTAEEAFTRLANAGAIASD